MTFDCSYRSDIKDLFYSLRKKRAPGQVVIQFTDHCNARCPQCGMNVSHHFNRSKLAREDILRIVDAAADKDIKVVSFTGGEPFLFTEELTRLIHYAGKAGIKYIRTGTNGYFFAHSEGDRFLYKINKMAESLSKTPLRNLWISIDSAVAEEHEKMRGFPGIVKGIEKALPIFHAHGIYPSANLGINRNIAGHGSLPVSRSRKAGEGDYFGNLQRTYKKAFRRFYRFITDLGFTMASNCYPMSIEDDSGGNLEAVYGATSENAVIHFTHAEKAVLYKALFEVIPEIRSKIRVFSPLSSIYELHAQYENPARIPHGCRGGIDFFFISAKDGNAYPCGYRGKEALGKFWDLNLNALDTKSFCHECDWECFRDPTELFEPILQVFDRPLAMMSRYKKNKTYYRLWARDLEYYHACDFFDGRKPPDFQKMSSFARKKKRIH